MSEMSESLKKFARSTQRKSAGIDLSAYEFGKIPPKAIDLEEAVLGACMIEKEALDSIIDILQPDAFYGDAHQKIYKAIKQLYGDTKPIDILTVADQLRTNGELEAVGGPYYLAELTNRIASAANVEFHARIVAQKYIQRELIRVSSNIIKDAYEDTTDVFELLDEAEKNLFAIADENLRKNGDEISSIVTKEIEEISKRMSKAQDGDVLTGVGSGFTDLDRITAGWQKSDLIIVAARPGMGKTSFNLAIARNAAIDLQKPVAFFSLEMNTNQLVQRLISMESEINADKLRKGTLEPYEWTQLTTRVDKLTKAPIIIDDTPALNIFELRAKCRRYKEKYGIEMVIIDYLQLMTGSNADGRSSGNREQEISQISRSLKSIAKELNIPIIALSQLSRAVETRGGAKRPMLSDLRESGAIEQDADIVIFLYRPEYYDITQDEDGNDTRGTAEIIIAKHRNGELNTVKTKFIGRYAKFANLDDNTYSFEATDIRQSSDYEAPAQNNYKILKSKMDDNDEVPF
jgi:replicative DNA helicase